MPFGGSFIDVVFFNKIGILLRPEMFQMIPRSIASSRFGMKGARGQGRAGRCQRAPGQADSCMSFWREVADSGFRI